MAITTVITTTSTPHTMINPSHMNNFLLLLGLAVLTGCTVVPGLDLNIDRDKQGAPAQVGGYDLIPVTPAVILELEERKSVTGRSSDDSGLVNSGVGLTEDYIVGPGDVLTIIVWDHPELTNPTGEFRDPESSGRLVGPSGKIFYPYIGELKVSGLPVSSIRRLISAQLARVVKDPQVDVRVAAFRSQRVKVTGEVARPAVVPITDRGLTVSEALATAGGLTGDASRRLALLTRGGIEYKIDARSSSKAGLAFSDVKLRDGDILHVPNSDEYPVYVLGPVGNQAAIPLPQGRMSLAEAISKVNGLSANSADRRRVYVLRADSYHRGVGQKQSPRISIYTLDMENLTSLILSEHFTLYPRDVVYVDRTGLSTYNSVVAQVLPTVSTLFQLDRLLLNE